MTGAEVLALANSLVAKERAQYVKFYPSMNPNELEVHMILYHNGVLAGIQGLLESDILKLKKLI